MKDEKRVVGSRGSLFCVTVAILAVIGLTLGLSVPSQARTGKVHLTDAVGELPERPALFDQEVEPLKMEQCAQCHEAVFNTLKAMGKKHQKPCRFCHTKFHTLAPGKLEYVDAIPKCQDCHGKPHGEKEIVTTCGNCHSNAHSPVNLPKVTSDLCVNCHAGPVDKLQAFPSKHTELDCTECHTSHGLIPNCTDCHSEEGGLVYHIEGVQENSNCLGCHTSPHTPLEISYQEDTPKELCANCHINPSHKPVYNTLKAAQSKHWTEITCASCHDEHGKIPECSKCHDSEGHRADLMTSDCLRCHTNPHEPLNISFELDEKKAICGGCHTEVYDDLMGSKTRHTNQTCSFCHPVHGQIPTCQSCHGVPHGEALVKRFDGNCGTCHSIAHNVRGKMKDDVEGSLTAEGRKGFLTTVPAVVPMPAKK